MSEKTEKFEDQLNDLISRGNQLYLVVRLTYYRESIEERLTEELGDSKQTERHIQDLPNFFDQYQSWYSEALTLVKQVLPDRLDDFISYYKYSGARKELTTENYRIHDLLVGLRRKHGTRIIVDGRSAIPKLRQQLSIVEAAKETFGSALIDLKLVLQADLFDSEIDSARALAKSGFLRAAGAICGVVIEKHLNQVCDTHGVTISKKKPTISDFIQRLKDEDIISIPQWRFIQHLSDIRNICDHARDREPNKEEVDDLVSGTEKVLKTVF